MTGPAAIRDIPWDDPPELERWVRGNPTRITPAAAERLLGNEGFIDVGSMPSQGRVRCAAWKPRGTDKYPELALFTVFVYYTDTLSTINVRLILTAIEGLRLWKLLHRLEL